MNATYFVLQADGSQAGPVLQAQILAYVQQGVLSRESLIRRADLSEFFAVGSYPEFTQSSIQRPIAQGPISSVNRGPVAVARGVKAGAAKAAAPKEGRLLVWLLVAVWVALMGWGAKVGWEKWQESSTEKQQVVAEKWRKENLPDYRLVNLRKHPGVAVSKTAVEIMVEGEVEEKEARRHPEYGRAERREVYARLSFTGDAGQPIGSVPIEQEVVLIKDGKGYFSIRVVVTDQQMEDLARAASTFEALKVTGFLKYEK